MRTVLLLAAALGLTKPAAAQTTYFDDIGYNALVARLGSASVPTGAGIAVAQIEAYFPDYKPDPAVITGKTFNDPAGVGTVNAGHPTEVGRYFYGSQSIAPGITQVYTYGTRGSTATAGDWIGPGYLNVGGPPPLSSPARVQNFSFVAFPDPDNPDPTKRTTPDSPIFLETQRRLDYAVRRDNFVAVVAVGNGAGPIPALLANGYNSIAVGLTNGDSSFGPTTGDTAGRSKPDIVAPATVTSYATPIVSAASALLLNVADAKSDPTVRASAGRAETIKAVLLSGATTSEFNTLAKPWTRDTVTVGTATFQRPLDARFGAGELNIDNSHKILSAAQGVGTALTVNGRYGWDYQTVSMADAVRRYYIDAPAGIESAELTATVTWLRRVTLDPNPNNVSSFTLSELHLRLFQSDGSYTPGALLDESVSPIDNVQHIRTTGLQAGQRYVIEVSLANLPAGQMSEDFAVAWRLEPVPEPGWVLAVGAATVLAARRRRGRGCPPPAAGE